MVLPNKVWYMCVEVWVVVAGACCSFSFTPSGSIRPQMLARLSCSDGDAIQVGTVYVEDVRWTKGIVHSKLVALDYSTDLSVVGLSNREKQ